MFLCKMFSKVKDYERKRNLRNSVSKNTLKQEIQKAFYERLENWNFVKCDLGNWKWVKFACILIENVIR